MPIESSAAWIGSRPIKEINPPELLAVLPRIESRCAIETWPKRLMLAIMTPVRCWVNTVVRWWRSLDSDYKQSSPRAFDALGGGFGWRYWVLELY